MMISPKSFRDSFKDESLETCIKEKNKLENEIKEFKEGKRVDIGMNPSPAVVYKCNVLYLKELEKVIKKKEKEQQKLNKKK